ncbi:hypothetical protein HZC00_02380 [Candidatus Kaiserbacteria bacterium]|nr:hypothetical protein [Candidatus Kaiserbacteria bacterium]
MTRLSSKGQDLFFLEIGVTLIPLVIFIGGIALTVSEVFHPSPTFGGIVFICVVAQTIGGLGLWGFIDSFRR